MYLTLLPMRIKFSSIRPFTIRDFFLETTVIHEKGSGRINEDAISLNGTVFGVFDGATSLNKTTFRGNKTGGFLASNIARDIFRKNSEPLDALARKANEAILDRMLQEGVNVSDKASLWSTSCAVVKIREDLIEWVQTGDSLLLLIYEDGRFHVPITDFDHDRETLTMWKEMADVHPGEKIFDVLGDQILKIRTHMNETYGVLNGESSFQRFLNTGKAPRKNVKHILLFTDGLFLPSENPETETDFQMFVDIFLAGGLQALRDHVRTLEESDPHCRTYPRFKPHDDIAAISISF
jgi:serine/threonine protein phosphatase PrpC